VSWTLVLNTTLLIYDVIYPLKLITFGGENGQSSVLYIVQRYLPFFDTALVTLHHNFGMNLSVSYCHLNYQIGGCMFSTYTPCLRWLMTTLRVWAIWRTSIPVAIGIILFFLACWVPIYILIGQFFQTMRLSPLSFYNLPGCFIIGRSHVLSLCWVLLMVYDTCMLVMMLIPGVAAWWVGGRSELIKTIYRDGRPTTRIFSFP
ncbi:hypothetical protein L218DRAFT_883287, partial [Marasmius fiardii PR-910]